MATAQDEQDAADLVAWRGGDRPAGQRLFARYYEPVARFFINKSGDASGDLLQRTFLACLEGLPNFRGDGSFRSYIFAITLIFGVTGLVQILVLAAQGRFTAERLSGAAVAGLAVALATPLGLQLRRRLAGPAFDRAVLAALALSAVSLLVEALT